MKSSFVRVVSLVGALALPTVLIAQANPSAAKSTTIEKSTTKMETKTTDKGKVRKSSKKRHHRSKKTTQSQAAKPSAKK
jgi:hypothetical protein